MPAHPLLSRRRRQVRIVSRKSACRYGAKVSGRQYIWLPTEDGQAIPIGLYRAGKLYAVHTDHLGTPRLITNQGNEPVWQWPYSAFGNNKPTGVLSATSSANSQTVLRGTKPPVELNLRFPGQYWDEESNLAHNGHRFYRPFDGGYTQMDPAGLAAGWNRRIYANQDPLRFIDPFGLETGITVWKPVGWGESSGGHVSTDINGTTFSYGPGGMSTMPTSQYTSKNDFRPGMELKLNLTPQQEAALKACLSKDQGEYSALTNNCGTPVQNCLKALGIDTGNQLLPVSLGNRLIDMGLVKGIAEHLQSRPAQGTNAPWAR